MLRKRKKESTLNRILEVPKEICTNEPKLTIAGFKKMLIENYKVILEYQDVYIRIKTYIGIININGFNLKLSEMTSDDIMIEGYFVEKFINKCINENIFFWNVKREKSTIVYINTGIKDFKRLCRIARECKCKIQIKEKKGFPFILNRYRKRKIFAFFVILIAILLIVTSKFVWNIRVEGNNKINQSEIVSMLEQKGLKVGTLKSRVNSQEIINEIRLERADIAWIGISIEGTNAIVKIVEAEAKPEIINEEDYCNIIATKDAQIVKISAQNGIPVVKQDDVVTKGDILIAGWIDGKYTGTRYVHAEGEVKAKVWYTEKEKVALNQVIEEKTGNTEEKYKINHITT